MGLFEVVLGEGLVFEDMVLWLIVSEGGGFGVCEDGDAEKNEDMGLECEREGGLRRGWTHWASPRVSRGDFAEVSGRKTRAGEVYPERTAGTLYRSVSPGNSTGADRAGVYRARVGVNVTADKKKNRDKNQR